MIKLAIYMLSIDVFMCLCAYWLLALFNVGVIATLITCTIISFLLTPLSLVVLNKSMEE